MATTTKKKKVAVVILSSLVLVLLQELPPLVLVPIVSALQVQSTTSTGTTASATNDYSIIQRGGLFIQPNWINAEQIDALRRDIHHLRESKSSSSSSSCDFIPSGLSNRVSGDNNVFGKSDRLTCTITAELGSVSIRQEMDDKLNQLAEELSLSLSLSRSLSLNQSSSSSSSSSSTKLSLEEQYYSISPPGSLLPRHMDERHEETKGEKGWVTETRRSISWLLYLSESHVKGGELCSFIRNCKGPFCGVHEGNIQVGWLGSDYDDDNDDDDDDDDDDDNKLYDPVFLDCWVKTPIDHHIISNDSSNDTNEEDCEDFTRQWQPLYSLYRIVNKKSININNNINNKEEELPNLTYEREYISNPFGSHSPKWPDAIDLNPDTFGDALAMQLYEPYHDQFISVEQIHDHPEHVVPTAGTLVLFDSVVIPHQVLEVRDGERLALAGWFHEPQQDFPDWYGT